MIYTTYYNNLKNIPKDSIIIPISRKIPDGVVNEYININKLLRPPSGVFSKYMESNNFYMIIDGYGKYLNNISNKIDLVVIGLKEYETDKSKNIFLVCFEKNDTKCHRSVLAKYLRDVKKLSIKEFR